ncbi:PREDICTED: uncharacterized protein LOC109582278 isoform X2 [Amphimedon queenslandica]|uniref:G-protein coupled receptors family 2 profile 2 domain-containing protein n=1 Tax=Amphimedon queenslandica TaxID=400682 RepID=A0AAN0J649_AMPQE|nr:PREDICTED: uncharacterized protein LOC109582278 isoform X2 [Amphimedon queenslandica]|eukprot:XP_019852499.1 PREDICTED: uncharacterized protein LOC109582278 isoform X2 [Amphimedon queenslandica]
MGDLREDRGEDPVEDCSSSSNSTMSTLSNEEKYQILLVMGTGGIAAVIICTVALAMALMFKLHHYFVHRLAIYQVLAALFFGFVCVLETIFINYDKNHKVYAPLCEVTGFLLEYAVWVKLLIMSCLTFHLLCFSVCYTNFNRLEYAYILISIVIPLLFSWIPFIHGVYGPAGAWCWIQNWKKDCADNKLSEGEIEEYALLFRRSSKKKEGLERNPPFGILSYPVYNFLHAVFCQSNKRCYYEGCKYVQLHVECSHYSLFKSFCWTSSNCAYWNFKVSKAIFQKY